MLRKGPTSLLEVGPFVYSLKPLQLQGFFFCPQWKGSTRYQFRPFVRLKKRGLFQTEIIIGGRASC